MRQFNDERIYYRLVNTKTNQILVDGVPSISFPEFGISKIFYMFLNGDENGFQSLLINDAVAQGFGYTLLQLKELADVNTHKIFPSKIRMLDAVVKEVQRERGDFSFNFDEYAEDINGEAYLLSNRANSKGASSMFDKAYLNSFAEAFDEEKLFILPVSEEQVLLYRASTVSSIEQLKVDMLELSEYEKENGEMLSDKVIVYDVRTQLYSVA